jgi:hypothetical protein
MADFLPGLELARLFYEEAVRPILEAQFPSLVHSAGLLGPGSEVLGFDDEMSTDHSWGPRVLLFLSEQDYAHLAEEVRQNLGHSLPFSFRGWPTHYAQAQDEPGTVLLRQATQRPINHRVQITTLSRFVRREAGLDLDRPLSVADWLTVPEQVLRSLVTGAVYHDGLDVVEPMRRRLAYYPHCVWLYLLAAQWQRIGQEEPFVGRAGSVGDGLGSAVIAGRLVRDVMRLCFLMEKQYAPYPKWFGSAFARLDSARRLGPILESALTAASWQERQRHLGNAYEILVTTHNELGLTGPQEAQVSRFHNRPFLVIQAEKIAQAIWNTIEDPQVRALPFGLGKVDQWVDSTDVLSHGDRCQRLEDIYSDALDGRS